VRQRAGAGSQVRRVQDVMMTNKIKKILIANRGEIACRVIKTARKMGIRTVAVYSDTDKKALHVRMADEAVHIGASPAAESYLVMDKIIDACKQTKADAVHPGYGFLSENPEFARRLKKENIIFIGPAPESMEAMGLKDAAKKLMEKANVPVTPGYHGKDQDVKLLKAKSGMIGYPVLIKAVAGGGGKGMRKVEDEKDFEDLLASCQREAKSSFGDDRVLIEKYILSPRHIEVQVFGDTHGNVVHMFERDCSLQRRHQKVIEEAPAPGMTDEVRKAMTDAAVKAAQAVDYVGAGTVEFIVDGSGKLRTDGFWFMEMNTRLQVEHPVTEMITGLDLVELQIRVAQGEKLPKQNNIKLYGHAVEARLYAEDPANDFLPSIGELWSINHENWRGEDIEDGGYRIDTGVDSKSKISIYYDPMIAKVIGYASTRDDAIENTEFGIVEIQESGLQTNSAFLVNCLKSQMFQSGNVHTNFIQDDLKNLIGINLNQRPEMFAFAALRLESEAFDGAQKSPYGNIDGWRLNLPRKAEYRFQNGDEIVAVQIIESNDHFALVNVDHQPIRVSFEDPVDPQGGNQADSIESSLKYYGEWAYAIRTDYVSITNQGAFNKVFFPTHGENAIIGGGNAIISPMPGKILDVRVKVGDTVTKGDKLIVMEAMKMEMSLEAPRDGVIEAIDCAIDDLVSDGAVLLSLETE
jgi:3-methylcrotonyl-CoA carboxylase alpha subunit